MNDDRIIDLYWARDDAAITESAQKYGRYCHAIADSILHDRQDSEECVNDTWLGAWNAMPPHRPHSLRAFLGKITRRLACGRLRTAHAKKRGAGELPLALEELTGCVPSVPSAAQAVEDAELEGLINAFLRALPERDCSLFLRRYWYLESIADISVRFRLPQNTVKSSLYRTRQKLKTYLEKEGISV